MSHELQDKEEFVCCQVQPMQLEEVSCFVEPPFFAWREQHLYDVFAQFGVVWTLNITVTFQHNFPQLPQTSTVDL